MTKPNTLKGGSRSKRHSGVYGESTSFS